MWQAKTTFHIRKDPDGPDEELVRAGKVFPDGHPYIARDITGELFEKLDDDVPPPPAAPKRGPVKSNG